MFPEYINYNGYYIDNYPYFEMRYTRTRTFSLFNKNFIYVGKLEN